METYPPRLYKSALQNGGCTNARVALDSLSLPATANVQLSKSYRSVTAPDLFVQTLGALCATYSEACSPSGLSLKPIEVAFCAGVRKHALKCIFCISEHLLTQTRSSIVALQLTRNRMSSLLQRLIEITVSGSTAFSVKLCNNIIFLLAHEEQQESGRIWERVRQPEPRMTYMYVHGLQEWITSHSEAKFNNVFHTPKELGHHLYVQHLKSN